MSAERPADDTPQRTPASDSVGEITDSIAAVAEGEGGPHPAPPPPPLPPDRGSAEPNPSPDPPPDSQIQTRPRRKRSRRSELLSLRQRLEEVRALDVAHDLALAEDQGRPMPPETPKPDLRTGPWPHAVEARVQAYETRRASLRRLVFAATHDGQDVVDFYDQVFRGEGEYPQTFRTKDGLETVMVAPPLGLRLEAAAWLADRAWGKATEYVKGQVSVNPMTVMRPQLLAALRDPETARLMAEASRRITLLPPGPLPLPPGGDPGTEVVDGEVPPEPEPQNGNGNGNGNR